MPGEKAPSISEITPTPGEKASGKAAGPDAQSSPAPAPAPAKEAPVPVSSPPPERGKERVADAETVVPAPTSAEPKAEAIASKKLPKAGWIVIPNSGKVPVDPTEGAIEASGGSGALEGSEPGNSAIKLGAHFARDVAFEPEPSVSRGNRQPAVDSAAGGGRGATGLAGARGATAQPRTRSASTRRSTWSRAGRTTGPSQDSITPMGAVIAPFGKQMSESIPTSKSFTSMTSSSSRRSRTSNPILLIHRALPVVRIRSARPAHCARAARKLALTTRVDQPNSRSSEKMRRLRVYSTPMSTRPSHERRRVRGLVGPRRAVRATECARATRSGRLPATRWGPPAAPTRSSTSIAGLLTIPSSSSSDRSSSYRKMPAPASGGRGDGEVR